MTATALARRVFVGSIIQPDENEQPSSAYKDITSANDHLHTVLNALLKERSGQPLTETEKRLVEQHIAAKRWQLEHQKKF